VEDWIAEVRMIDVFVDAFIWLCLGLAGSSLRRTGPPPYHPAVLLKLSSMATSGVPVKPRNRGTRSSAIPHPIETCLLTM
jgi:hypothetical protein